jgi:hypothetical protein
VLNLKGFDGILSCSILMAQICTDISLEGLKETTEILVRIGYQTEIIPRTLSV